jgi:hypothetical protein
MRQQALLTSQIVQCIPRARGSTGNTNHMLSDDEILRRLREVRHSPQASRNARQAVSINGIANAANLSRCHVHDLQAGRRALGPISRLALSEALTSLQSTGSRSQPLR